MSNIMTLPPPEHAPIVSVNRQRMYRTPDGDFPSVTTILKVLGLSTNALVAWSANQERAAVLEAAADVYSTGVEGGVADFAAAIEAKLGHARQHQKILSQAGEIGTSIHQAVQRRITMMLGLPVGPEPKLVDAAEWALMAWEDWWKSSGLTPVRTEQPVWHAEKGFAGTIDLIARDANSRLGIVDLKTGKGIYDDYHLQVAAYTDAARWLGADIEWGMIVRVPKITTDPAFQVCELGTMYERTLTLDQLISAFDAATIAWKLLVQKH